MLTNVFLYRKLKDLVGGERSPAKTLSSVSSLGLLLVRGIFEAGNNNLFILWLNVIVPRRILYWYSQSLVSISQLLVE